MKRDRARPKQNSRSAAYDETTGASRTSRKRENKCAAPLGEAATAAVKNNKYAPPTTVNNYETIQPSSAAAQPPIRQYSPSTNVLTPTAGGNQLVTPASGVMGRAVISPRSDCNVDAASPKGERPPARVFFPRDNAVPLQMDDSLTIDSGLDDPSIQPTNSPASPAVYHLARDDGLRKPSAKHRAKLEAWYRKNGKDSSTSGRSPRSSGGGGASRAAGGRSRAGLDPRRQTASRDEDRNYHADMSRSLSTDDEGSNYTGFSQGLSTIGTNDYPESLLSKEIMSEDEDFLQTKQEIALLSISLTSIQLLTICLQFAMCGIAPLEINPFVGPFPDAFSEWGGKNAYLMLTNHEYWRVISPSALSVGILHLLANAFCQLEPIAIFEREWGSFRWLLIYLLSAVGCNTLSVYMDPDSIAVGSSGSLMGLFAAKLAQVLIHTLFDVNKRSQDEFIRLDQLSSVVCGLIIVSLFSFFTYIDWSGHLGGLMAGFFAGMVLFSNPIRSCCVRFLWTFLGLTGLTVTLTGSVYLALTETDPSEDLADACYYFRNLYPEDTECGCFA